MLLASYNVENLFERARVMNLAAASSTDRWEEGRRVLNDYAAFNALIGKTVYEEQDKQQIVELLKSLDLATSDEGEFVVLRQNRNRLISRHRDGTIEVVANGRADWIGWVDLIPEPVNATAILNTAQVIRDVAADVQAVVEAEDRLALVRFSQDVLPKVGGGTPFAHVMLVDGNDARGIDVGVLTRSGYPIELVRSHVDDLDERGGAIFSRDCPEYLIRTRSGHRLWVLINHLKSKGYGPPAQSSARRKVQSARVRQIYDALAADGEMHIAVVGDMNDTPDSDALAPLLTDGSTLKDISTHPNFDDGGRPGTYGNCANSNKIDYILLSPGLYKRVVRGGIFRKGVWGGTHGTLWEIYPEMKSAADAASDHAAIWAEISV
jgi:endonuclease/exonuclease/phosphatase family metal-dependent hydrolase